MVRSKHVNGKSEETLKFFRPPRQELNIDELPAKLDLFWPVIPSSAYRSCRIETPKHFDRFAKGVPTIGITTFQFLNQLQAVGLEGLFPILSALRRNTKKTRILLLELFQAGDASRWIFV